MKKKKETPMHPVVENIRKIIMDKGISFDLSPIARQCTAGVILLLFSLGEVTTVTNISYTMQRVRRPRTEYRIRRHETSIYQPYIIN